MIWFSLQNEKKGILVLKIFANDFQCFCVHIYPLRAGALLSAVAGRFGKERNKIDKYREIDRLIEERETGEEEEECGCVC